MRSLRSLSVVAALLLNHAGDAPLLLIVPALIGLAAGIFVIAGATPAALGLLADLSEAFPRDRGAVMGLYSVFLALGQIAGALLFFALAVILARFAQRKV